MLPSDPVERLANVIINLGLLDQLNAGTLTMADGLMVIDTIRSGDEWGVGHGDTPFPWTDEHILARLIAFSMKVGAPDIVLHDPQSYRPDAKFVD